ncbi:MAG: hypothetical protein COB67_01555 [SAR324 cluster bacterium]|uniref:Type II secretion system protein GspF domain-containing protein n=1 Tax=SAR324 cluster bacterium TaxID=2024889 RepID=A0A2A4TAU4_9DELT|nr:MAG: hypothetical protein COB67_01555 [SAR324 cluster bacterium]
MALYEYRAIEKNGKNRKGKIDAGSLKQATSTLQSQGLYILSIGAAKGRSASARQKEKKSTTAAIPSKVITGFTRQFAILVSTGIPYDKSLEILVEEGEHPEFQHVLSALRAQVLEGSSLAGAMASHPRLFSKMYVAMVRAGEAGGTLAKVLEQIARVREEEEELKAKIQSAMIYPVIMVFMGLGIVVFMISFILPKIVPIFQQFNVQLPLPTRIVMFASDLIVQHWLTVLILLAGSFLAGRRFFLTRAGRKLWDQSLLKIPVLGKVVRKITVFRFTQTMGTMLESGVELKQALEIVKYALGNRVFEDTFDQVILDITRKGMDLSQALRKSEIFPVTVIQMIRVGEESSQLEKMLNQISIILEKEVKQTVEKAVALLEPVMILWMAAMVGFIVLAIMMPMFEMNQLI